MLLALLRSLLLAMLLALSALAAMQYSASGGSAAPLLLFLVLAAIVGPFWPSSEKIERWRLFFDRYPTASYGVGNVLVILAGAGIIWYGLNWDDPTPTRRVRTLLRLFGREGVVVAYVLFGGFFLGAGIIGCIKVFKKNV